MKTKISILVLMLAFTFNASAQTIGDYIDVVYLKDGSIVKGVIVEQVPGKSIKIETNEAKVLDYSIYDIAKFTREVKNDDKATSTNTKNDKNCTKSKETCASKSSCASANKSCCGMGKILKGDYKQKDKGYFAEIGIGGNTSAYSFRVTNGYKFGRFGYVGVAVGLENVALNTGYRLPELSLNLVYAGDILKRKITPYYQIEAGYGLSLDRYGYNKNLLNNNKFEFGKAFGKGGKDKIGYDANSYSTLNYGGPQGALELGVKIHTQKKIYFKLGLDARLTSNFSDVHYLTFDKNGNVNGSELKENLDVNPGIGARFTIGF